MNNFLRSKEYWSVVESGFTEPAAGEVLSATEKKVLEELKLKDLKIKNYLFQSIDKTILKTITQMDTAKQLWDSMKTKYQGNARVQRAQLQILRRDFEVLEMKFGELVTDYIARVLSVSNKMRNLGEDMPDMKIVEKILRTLTENFNYIVCSIEESKDINTLTVDELQSSLTVHEQKFRRHREDDQALRIYDERYGRRGRGRGNFRGRGNGRTSQTFNRATVECFRCHKLGHFQYECPRSSKEVNYAEIENEGELLLMAHVEIHKGRRSDPWFLDSGCSNHMCGDEGMFTHLDKNFEHSVKLGNDNRMRVVGKGTVKLLISGLCFVIKEVYFVPELSNNLLSLGQLQENGLAILIHKGMCKIYHPVRGLIIETRMSANRMFVLQTQAQEDTGDYMCNLTASQELAQLWHRRYGHLSHKGLQTLVHNNMVHGLPQLQASNATCTDCISGKHHRDAIPKEATWRAAQPLELVHADICGPISPTSNSGKRYVLCFIDDFTRKAWAYLLTEKREAFMCFKQFQKLVEKEKGLAVKCLRTDRGGEFTSHEFNEYCSNIGMRRQLTAAYTPQQNGVAERKNRTVMNMVRCMLSNKRVPKVFWAEAVNWTFHVLNRCPTAAIEGITPQEAWSGMKPSVEHFRIFGCLAHAHIPCARRGKLDSRSTPCVLLGVSKETKGYRLYDPKTKKITVS